jgi:hypothetical protein
MAISDVLTTLAVCYAVLMIIAVQSYVKKMTLIIVDHSMTSPLTQAATVICTLIQTFKCMLKRETRPARSQVIQYGVHRFIINF